MEENNSAFDRYVSAAIRGEIERRFYARANYNARLEQLRHDPLFLSQPHLHPGTFSDHGVVHMSDVARQLLIVLDRVHGVLIPSRSQLRLERMRAYGVLAACFHDVGMFDTSDFGRQMHPEFASQALFTSQLDDILQAIERQNSGDFFAYLSRLSAENVVAQAPSVLLRELLSLVVCHSKSKVPIELLNDPPQLRQFMLRVVGLDLRAQFEGNHVCNEAVSRFYDDFEGEAYRWLTLPHPALRQLRDDVIDVQRVLRCADALRQRGTVLKTSGGYEIFVDQRTADAIIAFRLGDDRLYLLELHDPISAGEANIAASELDPSCDLRLSFHRGAFATPEAVSWATTCAATVVNEIQEDVIHAFDRPHRHDDAFKRSADMRILLEETEDNVAFVSTVRHELAKLNPSTIGRVRIVPSLQVASERERRWYLTGQSPDWTADQRRQLLVRLERTGHLQADADVDRAFEDVRLIHLEAGDILLEAGAPAIFVYIPLGPGLEIRPLGGYSTFRVRAWMPVGNTGVIRGAPRNATICATAGMDLLMIPRRVYLHRWHRNHSPTSLAEALKALDDDHS